MSRTFSTSRIQREVIQHHGHSGSNQKSARDFSDMLGSSGWVGMTSSTTRRTASSVPSSDRLERVLPNLTRDQAIERAALVTVDNYRIVLDLTGPATKDLPLDHHRRVRGAARRGHLHRPGGRHRAQRGPQRPRDRRVRLRRVHRHPAARAGPAQHAGGGGRLPLLEHRRGPAPLRRPRRRRGLPVLAVRNRRRQADVRLLRPARPQGDLRRHGHRARALAGDLQRGDRRPSRTARRRCTPSPPPRG